MSTGGRIGGARGGPIVTSKRKGGKNSRAKQIESGATRPTAVIKNQTGGVMTVLRLAIEKPSYGSGFIERAW